MKNSKYLIAALLLAACGSANETATAPKGDVFTCKDRTVEVLGDKAVYNGKDAKGMPKAYSLAQAATTDGAKYQSANKRIVFTYKANEGKLVVTGGKTRLCAKN